MIRFAKLSDVNEIMLFIKKHWKKDHILAKNKEFFLFQHYMSNELTYVISLDEKACINGILGYIPYGKTKRDLMLVMWKVIHTEDAMLGIRLLQYLINNVDARIVASPGINKKTCGIYEYLGYHTGKMKHWYRLNKRDIYKIADVKNSFIPNINIYADYKLIKIETYNTLKKCLNLNARSKEKGVPFKENWYIKARYFEHPIYKYDIYGVEYSGKVELVIITRVVECNDSKAIRLIDCIGKFEQIRYLTALFDDLLMEVKAEYIDFYEIGLQDDIFINAGWLDVNETNNIIPEYFSPYERKNIDIYYFSTEKDIVLFKGDGDQDRPN